MFLSIDDQTAASSFTPTTPDAYAVADFVNGIYTHNGSPVTLADVITDEVPSVVTGSGLHLIAGHTPRHLVSNFYDAVFTFNWTIVFEVDLDANNGDHVIFNAGQEAGALGYSNDAYLDNFGGWDFFDRNNDYPGTPPGTGAPFSRDVFDDQSFQLTNGIHRVGITRVDGFIALSVDGASAQIDNSSTFSINTNPSGSTDIGATLGNDRYNTVIPNSFYIRSMKIYDPVDNATLALLSAP